MLAVFCLRLAVGMLACLLLLPTALIHPRFYRTHFLTALGLSGLAFWPARDAGSSLVLVLIGIGAALAFVSVVVWSMEGAPGGRTGIILTCAVLAASLVWLEKTPVPPGEEQPPGGGLATRLSGDAASAALLGSAMTAMLLGHSYLIAPGLSLTPLLRLLGRWAWCSWHGPSWTVLPCGLGRRCVRGIISEMMSFCGCRCDG